MKTNKTLVKTQRKSLDEKLLAFIPARNLPKPKSGWVRAIREALGMTTTQLAERMGIQQSGVTLLEQREVTQKISMETLQRAAQAMNCELVYALVPRDSLEKIVDDQAIKSATEILKRTLHTMDLEQQNVGAAETKLHLQELATEIKNKLDRRLWGHQ
ncbi:MAG: transcriptional regulator [Bdellovibrio sp. CG10_big_fil_rev_8_21_14_0_10_47_8]|nr:MAG: transcriptional regulator [Bdellovibrio sp. CG10_big_fil_rev_8_21_14_0_10_47_8]